jgi:hypothetical protein
VKGRPEDILKQAKPAPISASSRRSIRRRIERQERRRPRLLRARQDGAGVRRRRIHAAAGSDQRSGEDAVRVLTSSSSPDKKPGTTRPFAELRQQLADQLSYERAQSKAAELSATLEKQIGKPADLDKVAKAQGLAVQESGFFARDEPILGLGPSPEAASRAFEMKTGEVSPALRASRGFAFITPIGKQDPYVPKLDEVKERVRDEVIKRRPAI